jgi:isoquinoline 1-oxidoreductase beta subunit
MEPLNCTVEIGKDGCDIYTGTQFQTMDQGTAAAILGLKPEQVRIHTTFLGGGFGRRATPSSDFVAEAVQVAKASGKTVKVVWTREDDIHGGYYRPMWLSRLRAALGSDGKPIAWAHTIVGQSILAGTPFEKVMVKDGIDTTSVEGAADAPYLAAIPAHRVDLHSPTSPVTRAVVAFRSATRIRPSRSKLHRRTAHAANRIARPVARCYADDANPQGARSGCGEIRLRRSRCARSRTGMANARVVRGYVAQIAVSVEGAPSGAPRRLRDRLRTGGQSAHGRGAMQSGIVYGLSAALHSS